MRKPFSAWIKQIILIFPLVFSCAVILLGLFTNFQTAIVDNFTKIIIDSKDTKLYFITFVSIILIIALVLRFRNLWWKKIPYSSDLFLIGIILLVSVSVRLYSLFYLTTVPRSDFGWIHKMATDFAAGQYLPVPNPQAYLPIYHNDTVIVYGYLYQLFGINPLVIKMFNLLAASTSCVLLFYSGKLLGNRNEGFIGALLFALWPSQIVYINVLSSENIYILLSSMFLFAYSFSIKVSTDGHRQSTVMLFGIYLLLGLLVTLSEAFRPFGLIGLIALIISDLFIRFEKPAFSRFKNLIFIISLLSVSTLSYFLCRQLPIIAYEKMNKTTFFSTKSVNILIGLNFETHGMYSNDDWAYAYSVLAQVDGNQSEFDSIIINASFQRVRENLDQIGSLLFNKIAILWSGDAGIYWAIPAGHFVNMDSIFWSALLINACYMIVIAVLMLFTFANHQEKMVKLLFFCSLSILGFNLLEFIGEVQSRYMTVLTPYMAFLAAFGAVGIYRAVKKTGMPDKQG